MGTNWTDDQLDVINTHGNNILVSAAAGSGKTAVLVERIIQLITDEKKGLDVDRLLVVTFTNAAAAEMRQRIGQAIEECLKKDPENRHILRQSTLLHNAMITTIHSFGLSVIRNHFYRIGIDPGFRVGDEQEITLLKGDVMGQVLEEAYDKAEPGFLKLIAAYSGAKSDKNIEELIMSLYTYAASYPWPDEWLDDVMQIYSIESPEEFGQQEWLKELTGYARQIVADHLKELDEIYELSQLPEGPNHYGQIIEADIEELSRLLDLDSYQEWQQAIQAIKFQSLKRGPECNEELKEEVKGRRNAVKDNVKKLGTDYFAYSLETSFAMMLKQKETVQELVKLAKRFMQCFQEAKAEKNIIDFSDIEHFALDILIDRDSQNRISTYTDAAIEYREMFYEIMVDEYQDSNNVQETLLRAVSHYDNKDGGNMFMVGDVKQSIYRFRLARPELFVEKYNSYTGITAVKNGKKPEEGIRIDLHNNFRSNE